MTTEALIKDYGKKVYNLAWRFLMNADDAQDVVQETFLQVHRNLGQFRGESEVYTWIYRIALNIIRRFSTSAGERTLSLINGENDLNGQDLPPALIHQGTQEQEFLFREISREIKTRCHSFLTFELTSEQRPVFILREFLHLSYQDIGQILEITEDVVRSRLKRARTRLETRLNRQCSWVNPQGTCTCRAKVGYVLKKYPELLQKYLHRLSKGEAAHLVSQALQESPKSLQDVFSALPEVEFKIKPFFPPDA